MYVVIADVPGVSKDRITVSVKDDKILIEGKEKEEGDFQRGQLPH